jgi:hypothetical protein
MPRLSGGIEASDSVTGGMYMARWAGVEYGHIGYAYAFPVVSLGGGRRCGDSPHVDKLIFELIRPDSCIFSIPRCLASPSAASRIIERILIAHRNRPWPEGNDQRLAQAQSLGRRGLERQRSRRILRARMARRLCPPPGTRSSMSQLRECSTLAIST